MNKSINHQLQSQRNKKQKYNKCFSNISMFLAISFIIIIQKFINYEQFYQSDIIWISNMIYTGALIQELKIKQYLYLVIPFQKNQKNQNYFNIFKCQIKRYYKIIIMYFFSSTNLYHFVKKVIFSLQNFKILIQIIDYQLYSFSIRIISHQINMQKTQIKSFEQLPQTLLCLSCLYIPHKPYQCSKYCKVVSNVAGQLKFILSQESHYQSIPIMRYNVKTARFIVPCQIIKNIQQDVFIPKRLVNFHGNNSITILRI
ncbi:hypothetical protein pb186bvf_003122 [Paramecium bursaria]